MSSSHPSTGDLAVSEAPASMPGQAAQHAQAKALFAELVDLPAAAQAERLAALAAGGSESAQLAELLRELLGHAAQPHSSRITAPIAGLLAGLAEPANLPAGTRLGAWTLLRKIGEGGMGSVYQAQRSDGHYDQAAAVKLLRGLPSPAALAVLAGERQILAGLNHPNIARLLDGGTTPEGQPYLVMEYIDGLPIDQYCAQMQLPVAEVLRLLVEVCGAVGFAHSRLVVHCDLKPSNILVDAQGRPLLLDFGIARLLGPNPAEQGDEAGARPRLRAFTPGYASPEQERGDPVSTLADVYSLGRLLHDLLGSARLARAAELRAIIAMATLSEPAARYGSAAALARDLQRYLLREPLQALPPRWHYRAGKLLQRRWPAALVLAAFALTVAAFTWQLADDRDRARAAERLALAARDQAAQAEAAAQQISAFLARILSSVDPDNARSMDRTLMRTLLDQAASRAQAELGGQPAIRRQIETVVADSYRAISEYDAAVVHYGYALQTLGEPAPGTPPTLERLELQYQQAVALIGANRHGEAAALLAPTLDAAERLLGAGAELPLKLRTQQAYQLFWAGQLQAALAAAQDTQRRFEASRDISPEAWLQQLNILSLLLSNSDRFEQAQVLMQRAIAISSDSYGAAHSRTLRARHSLAVSLLQQRRRAEAIELLRPLLADMEQALGPAAPLTISAVSNLGTALRGHGQLAASAQYYRIAHQRALQRFGATNPLTLDLANNLALYELAAGKPRAALARIEAVITRSEQRHDRTHPSLVEALRTRAKVLAALGQRSRARSAWQDVVARDLEVYGPDDSQTRADQAALALLERGKG